MSERRAKVEIELHSADRPRVRTTVYQDTAEVAVPVLHRNMTFGQRLYMDSGLRTEDGTPIWIEQERGSA